VTDRRTALVVDSGAALSERVGGGRAVVPLHVQVGDEVLDGSADSEIYRRLRRGEIATTSTPSPGDYLAAFEAVAAAGCRSIVCLTIPSRWSGMHGSATIAAGLYSAQSGAVRVDVVETSSAAAGFGLVARIADALCEAGADSDAVLARVARAAAEVHMYGALATLEFVSRSGRVPALVAGVSDALHVRPVFEMHRSGTGRVGLARTDSGVLRTLERVAHDTFRPPMPVWVLLFHADAGDVADQLGDRIKAACNVVRCESVALAPVIGVHTGPGAVGFAALPLHEDDPVLAG
jgi:DegV family protein with EDD domain